MRKLFWLSLGLMGLPIAARANPNPTVDCNCLQNLPALHTYCPGIVPDISVIGTNCFSTNVDTSQMGFCLQVPPPGYWLGPGTNSIQVTVYDTNYNSTVCTLDFVVTPFPTTNLTFTCSSNKTVECGTAWQFDTPVAFSTCCSPGLTVTNTSTITNGTCPKVITKTWQANDMCGNTQTCSQTITIIDSTPPVALCSGANLVPNPGFESLAYCPDNLSEIDAAFPWFTPTISTPDAFNVCAAPASLVSVPTNGFGVQNANSGQGYAGAYVYGPTDLSTPGSPYREYIETPLLTPLLAGQTYQVSFYVNLADFSGRAIAEIGAYFSAGPVPVNNVGSGNIPVIPQVVNPSANILNSTSAWMLVQGTFIATGGEDHLTIGNFRNDANTTSTNRPSPPQYAYYSYYYYDDISVTALCNPQVTNKVVQCGAAITFDTPTAFDLCSGTNVSVSVSSTTVTGSCPRIITRNWTLTDACGNTNNWSQTVTVIDTNPPIVLCPGGTNLVPNPQFESYTNCPLYTSQFDDASPWFTPTLATSDYFNSCAGPGSLASVPTNGLGVQPAFSGNGYGGAILYMNDGGDLTNSYREYLEVPLTAPLVAGQSYAVSFHVSLGDFSSYAIAEIGAYFSAGPLVNYATVTGFPVTPQVMNSPFNILASTNSWMLVQGVFTAAGGEDHLILGSFVSDADTTAIPAAGTQPWAYYYFDDVSVTPACAEATNKVLSCGAPWTFDSPMGFDACSGTNVAVTVASTTTNACGTFFSRTWTLTDLCGNATNWTQTVTISDPTPLSINCACLSEAAVNLLYTNGCVGRVPDLLQFTNCFSTNCRPVTWTQSLLPGSTVGPGSHLITVSGIDCLGNSNGCQLTFTVAGSPPSITCPKNLVLYTCGTGAYGYFTPTALNNIGPVICSPPSGTFFPVNLSTLVTCTASNNCGTASCTFGVTVIRPPGRFSCLIASVLGIPTIPLGNAYFSFIPDSPDGGTGVDFENLGSSGQDGARFDFGPAQKFTFSTSLDFNAPDGAAFQVSLPPNPGQTTDKPLLTFKKSSSWQVQVDKDIVSDTGAKFRSIAIGTNGDLFSSFSHDRVDLGTNVLVRLNAATGASSAMVTITIDCLTRELTLGFPHCEITPDNARRGWDGLIYGNPRPAKTNKTARVIFSPITPVVTPPITNLDLLASNLAALAFDNPSITTMGRKWGDGHVTLIKAYDDGEEAISFASGAAGGGVTTDLGNAATFRVRTGHFQNGDVPNEEQLFTIRGWPPGTTTNRPPPPPIFARISTSSSGTGVDCSADYTSFGISNVTLQLWNGTALVTEKPNVPASLASVVTLSDRPTVIGSPGLGVLSLAHTNPFIVFSGLDCPPTGCVGTELRILPQSSALTPPPVAFGEFTYNVTKGTDNLLSELQTTPACAPVPLDVQRDSTGAITISWAADGFHLMGAENATGPWYDLGVTSPVVLNGGHPARYFRLACD